MKFDIDIDTFAAERRQALERGDETLGPSVATALVRFRRTPQAAWYSGILTAVRRLWDEGRRLLR